MVLWLAKRIYCLSKEVRAASNNHSGQILVDGFSAALCGQFTAALLSAPMIVSLIFYIQLGCVVGALARMSEDERPYKWLSALCADAYQQLLPTGTRTRRCRRLGFQPLQTGIGPPAPHTTATQIDGNDGICV